MDKGYSGLNPYKNIKEQNLKPVNNDKNPSTSSTPKESYSSLLNISNLEKENTTSIKKHPYSDPKYAPIKIPAHASIKKQSKNGYEQVEYKYKRGKYEYTARWHTATPNSPIKTQSWVISRKVKGVGYGNDAKPSRIEILSGKKWVSLETWNNAIKAKNMNKATKAQIKLLNNGHFVRKRGKKNGK